MWPLLNSYISLKKWEKGLGGPHLSTLRLKVSGKPWSLTPAISAPKTLKDSCSLKWLGKGVEDRTLEVGRRDKAVVLPCLG